MGTGTAALAGECNHIWFRYSESNNGQYGNTERFYCQRNPEHRLILHNGKIVAPKEESDAVVA